MFVPPRCLTAMSEVQFNCSEPVSNDCVFMPPSHNECGISLIAFDTCEKWIFIYLPAGFEHEVSNFYLYPSTGQVTQVQTDMLNDIVIYKLVCVYTEEPVCLIYRRCGDEICTIDLRRGHCTTTTSHTHTHSHSCEIQRSQRSYGYFEYIMILIGLSVLVTLLFRKRSIKWIGSVL